MFKNISIKSEFQQDRNKAIFWMILRCLFFSVMSVSLGLISSSVGAFTIFFLTIFARFLLLLPPVIAYNGFDLGTKYYKSYIVRAFLTTIGFASYIISLKNMSINEVTAISYTAPLFTAIFASAILAEKLSIKRMFALVFGFIGAMIIIRPDVNSFNLGTFFAILTAMLWSLGDIVVKLQANTKEKIGTQLFWSTLFMIICSLPFAIVENLYFETQAPNNVDWIWVFIAGLFILLTNLALFVSCRYSDIAFLMPFSFSKLIFTAILTFAAFGDVLKSSTALGTIIIIASTVYLIRSESEAEKSITA